MNKQVAWSLILLIVVGAVYRIIPDRPYGFAPQIAMALFAGAVIKNKKWAFAIPIFSMFMSDLLYQFLYLKGISDRPGFYEGQLTNYILFMGITLFGMLMKRVTVMSVFIYSLITPTLFFLASNFFTWFAGAGLSRPKTLGGLMQAYEDGIPFYKGGLYATVIFSVILFGGHYLLTKSSGKTKLA
jgi:hypothetical protein